MEYVRASQALSAETANNSPIWRTSGFSMLLSPTSLWSLNEWNNYIIIFSYTRCTSASTVTKINLWPSMIFTLLLLVQFGPLLIFDGLDNHENSRVFVVGHLVKRPHLTVRPIKRDWRQLPVLLQLIPETKSSSSTSQPPPPSPQPSPTPPSPK